MAKKFEELRDKMSKDSQATVAMHAKRLLASMKFWESDAGAELAVELDKAREALIEQVGEPPEGWYMKITVGEMTEVEDGALNVELRAHFEPVSEDDDGR